MGCCNNPNYQSRAARESINRSAYEACQCADRSCECKDLAEQYAQNAEETWNDFQTRYLGAYSVAPVTSTTGALYFNTVSNQMFVWNGTTWTAVPAATIIGDGDKGDITVSGLGSTWTIDNGAVTSAKIADGTIVNGDISNTAAIAGTKISPNFGSQDVSSTGTISSNGTGGSFALLFGGTVDGATLRLNRAGSASQNAYVAQFQGSLFIQNLDSGSIIFANTTNNTERMRIDSSGNVGIGTSSPTSKLQVEGDIRARGTSTDYTALALENTSGVQVQIGANQNLAGQVACVTNHPFIIITNNIERVRITGGGDVGIGTASPSSKLHVDGDLTVSSATTANTATAGAQTLPANPVGFLVVSINGTSRKIPYYAT